MGGRTGQRFVHLDRPAEGIARLTLDRPPVNALSREMVEQIRRAAGDLGDDPVLTVVLIAARGKAFCAGADLKERRGMSEEDVLETVAGIGMMTRAVASIPVPTIALISGAALGGGLELALACDLRVASASAKLGLPECSLAIIPGAGGTQRLARIAGPVVAKRWIFTGCVRPAEEALRAGLVDEVVEPGVLESAGLALAGEISRCGPVALRAAKQAIDQGLAAGALSAGLAVEAAQYRRVIPTKDRLEALQAFADKRPPRFVGR